MRRDASRLGERKRGRSAYCVRVRNNVSFVPASGIAAPPTRADIPIDMTPPEEPAIADRFKSLHGVIAAVVRLFGRGDWTLARGRAVEASLRAILLAWERTERDAVDDQVRGVLEVLARADHFDPAVTVDRGDLLERLLSLREGLLVHEILGHPQWEGVRWDAPADPSAAQDAVPQMSDRFGGLLAKAFTRLHKADFPLGDHVLVSVTDRRGTIVEVNERFCDISGYPRAELLGATHRLISSGRHSRGFYREMWRSIRRGDIWDGEICNRRKDGTYYWLHSTIIPVPGEGRRPREYVSVCTEVTASKAAEDRLWLLEQVVATSAGGVVIADALRPGYPICHANPAFGRLLGVPEAALDGRSLRGLLAAGQRAEVVDEIDAGLGSPRETTLALHGARAGAAGPEPYCLDLRLSPVLHDGIVTHVIGVAIDISELASTRQALDDREERLRRSRTYAGVGTWDCDIATGELHCSEPVVRLFGRAAETAGTTYETFLATVHPRDRAAVEAAVDAALTLGKPYDIEHRCLRPDGTVRWLRAQGRVTRDERGRPARMLGVVQDVTGRKALEADLQEIRRRLAETQRQARIGDWEADPGSGETRWSPALYALYRRDPASYRPRLDSFRECAHAKDAASVDAAIEAARRGAQRECLHRIVLPDGGQRWVRLRAGARLDESGRVVRLHGSAHDVTGELRRRDCARLLQEVLAATGDAVAIADRHGQLIAANAAYRRALRREEDQDGPAALHEAWAPPGRDAIGRAIQRGAPEFRWSGKLPMQRADGSTFVVRSSIGTVLDARRDVCYYVHTFRDAAAVDARTEDPRQADGPIDAAALDALADAGDALRAPVRSILGFAQLLARRPELSMVSREYTRHLLRAGRRLLEFSGELLDLARAHGGRLAMRPGLLSLDAAIDAALARAAAFAADRGVQLRREPSLPVCVRVDRVRVEQLIEALARSAVECASDAAVIPFVTGLDRAGGVASIRITVPEARGDERPLRRWIETPGDRGDFEGAGLAVRIACLLAARMGATIRIETGTAPGAVVVVDIPKACADVQGPGTSGPRRLARPPGAGATPPRILYIDDDHGSLALVQEAFRKDERMRLLVSPSAMLGMELARAHRPEVILLDVDSPGVDAFSVLRILKADPDLAAIPVIAVTRDATPDAQRRIEGVGFFRFIEKPISILELARVIEAALGPV